MIGRHGSPHRGALALLVCAMLTGALVAAHGDNRSAALTSMADAERAFARAAAERGVRAAFLEYLDDASIAFEPRFGPAKDVWRARPEPANPLATKLTWDPRAGDVSADGRLGWLTGPYVLVPDGDASRTAYGCYFSIWRRPSTEAPWRVYIDQGISTPVACESPATFVPYAKGAEGGAALTQASLLGSDRALDAKVKEAGIAEAFGSVLDEGARLHRHGQQPVVGASAIRAYLATVTAPSAFETLDGMVAGSGDLGFTYGRVANGTGTQEGPAYYVRVWRRGPAGQWRLVFDTLA